MENIGKTSGRVTVKYEKILNRKDYFLFIIAVVD